MSSSRPAVDPCGAAAPVAGSCGELSTECGTVDGASLSLQVHWAAQGMRAVLDRVCREQGLNDFRDWMILTVLTDEAERSQLEIARLAGIDKSTLTALLDRLERLGLVVRPTGRRDRRVRVPRSTDEGRRVRETVARAREEIERALLADLSTTELGTVREVLVRLAEAGSRVPTSVLAAS